MGNGVISMSSMNVMAGVMKWSYHLNVIENDNNAMKIMKIWREIQSMNKRKYAINQWRNVNAENMSAALMSI